MLELTITLQQGFDAPRLQSELLTLAPDFLALSTYGQTRPVSIFLTDNSTKVVQAQTICTTHIATPLLPLPDPLVAAITQAKTDAGSTAIDDLTVTQAVNYINTNVIDLASAKSALIIAVKYIGEMRRELNLINNRLGL